MVLVLIALRLRKLSRQEIGDEFLNFDFLQITNCSKSLTRYDITSDLYGGTTYELGLGSCCNTMTDSPALCFSVFSTTDTATTAAGG